MSCPPAYGPGIKKGFPGDNLMPIPQSVMKSAGLLHLYTYRRITAAELHNRLVEEFVPFGCVLNCCNCRTDEGKETPVRIARDLARAFSQRIYRHQNSSKFAMPSV